jgi:diguanylate cyclase (GGDEF)-like protein
VVAVLEFYSDRRAIPDARTLDVMHHVGTQLGRVFERDRHAHAIRDLSLTDELTGLHNRRGFLTVAQRQLRLSARTGKPCLLLFLDMDGLKQINDHLGHEAGDAALIDLAAALRRAFRETDILARLGGDEFVALLPDSAERDASTVSDRLAATLARHNELAGRRFVLSVSLGVTSTDAKRVASIDELLSRADALMYEQKRQKKTSVTRLSALR